MKEVLGIDIGGTGIKGGLVNISKGEMISDRIKIETPEQSTPKQIMKVVKTLINEFDWQGKKIGVGFPAVIKNGVSLTASNVNKEWIGFPITSYFQENTGSPLVVVNDADAAGMAEVLFGKGKGVKGTVILLTLGTGIGSAIFKDGKLLHNTELGHIKYKGDIAEKIVSNIARKKRDLSWEEYGKELNHFLKYIERLFYPDLLIIGGGISKRFEKYAQHLEMDYVHPASQFNNAGIIGAALAVKA